jgi:hypothetical protein
MSKRMWPDFYTEVGVWPCDPVEWSFWSEYE